ncbi:hypothetical protein AB3X48_20710, partial [Bacillus sp. S4]|uniref:hypothetical protein n=1 Tax=Bacillus sp. S4 TaxID=125884 RepID=UPI00349F8945
MGFTLPKNLKGLLLSIILILGAVIASFNKIVFILFLITYLLFILVISKKFIHFMIISPFIALSFIPSGYVSVLRIQTALGQIRPSFILILLCLLSFPMISSFKMDLSKVREMRNVLVALGFFFIVHICSAVVNGLGQSNFQYSIFGFIYSFGALFCLCIYYKQINILNVIKSFLTISSIVCIIGITEFLGFQPYASLYLIDNQWFNYDISSVVGLPRVVSSMGNPLILSAYLLLCFPFVLYMRENDSKRNLWNIITVLHFLTILLTQSRSAFIILVLIILIYSAQNIN